MTNSPSGSPATEHYDLIIRNGMVIDGSGLPRRRVDVGVRDGRVARLAHLTAATADQEIDAAGNIVSPGIVDIHTHYDPQITFDANATMSCYHGVTTVLAGNCGFSVAPVKAADREFVTGIFAKVEQMDPIAMEAITWDEFETFGEFFESRRGKLGINLACYVGHSNLRRWVMGAEASERAATPDEVVAMRQILAEAMDAGAAGLSSSFAPTHFDIDDRPVPSRLSDVDELLALAEEMGRIGKGTIAFLPESSIGGLDDTDKDLLITLGQTAGLPVIIQGLGGRNKVDAPTATWEASVEFLDRATEAGAPVYSMLITRPFDRTVTIGPGNFHYIAVPSWDHMLNLPHDERVALLRDEAARDELRHAVTNYNRDPSKGTTVPPPQWHVVYVDRVSSPENEKYQSRSIQEIADELGVEPADAMLDIALSEDLETGFRWRTETPEWTDAVGLAQQDPRMVIGTSDGGAHIARDDGSDWSSYFLRSWVMDRQVWTLEEGIRQITQVPAQLAGFTDLGTITVGGPADIMIFDPDTIGPLRKEFVHDLPGGVGRFKALGQGVTATIVNGVPLVLHGELTGNAPGQVVAPS